jgi:hypothetical protein
MLSANQIATDRECEHTSNNGQLTQLLLQFLSNQQQVHFQQGRGVLYKLRGMFAVIGPVVIHIIIKYLTSNCVSIPDWLWTLLTICHAVYNLSLLNCN